jgi:hypothetical protein
MKRMNIRKTAASVVMLGLLAMAAPVSAQFGTGDVYTLTPQYYANTRELIYCELEFFYNGGTSEDVFNSTGLSDCDAQIWNFMDVDGLAAQFGYESLTQNGPQYWACDILTLNGGEAVNIGGIDMRYGATITAGDGIPPYTPFNPEKIQFLLYEAGKPIYQLVDPSGNTYVLQARKQWIQYSSLPTLGDQMTQLPEGWSYQSIVPDADVILNLTENTLNTSVVDEFGQVYIQYPVQPKDSSS